MRYPNFFLLPILAALCGCAESDGNDALNYAGLNDESVAQSSPAHPVEGPPPQLAAQDNARQTWCQSVAGSDVIKAQSDGFTADTVKRMAMISYTQCMTMAGVGR